MFKSVKSTMIAVIIAFALVITLIISLFSFFMIESFQNRIVVQSAEFNLQLVASMIQKDLSQLYTLGSWCAESNSLITNYFLSDKNNKAQSVIVFNRIQEELRNNPSNSFLRRLIVVNNSCEKLFHLTNYSGNSIPVTQYSVSRIEDYLEPGYRGEWVALERDPFFFNNGLDVVTLVLPVTSSVDRSTIGTMYLSASVSIITDKLVGYNPLDNSQLFLQFGDKTYEISANSVEQTDNFQILRSIENSYTVNSSTMINEVSENGLTHKLVSYPITPNILISQTINENQYESEQQLWFYILIGIILLILLLSLIIAYILERKISRPIVGINRKIVKIASGDFSYAPEIESESEIGQVGKGINKLSLDIVNLMETRIEDEKKKKDLEYRMLQNQINPHFIYNTLNSVKWMASIQGSEGIVEMTTALAHLLKSVSKDLRQIVPLREELELLDEYFTIQKYRYGGLIKLEKQIDEERLLDTHIPRFSLQPLVENAIFHGIEPKGVGTITIHIYQQEDSVFCSVSDDGIGMNVGQIEELKKNDSSKMFDKLGVKNVNERIKHAFGNAYGIDIQSVEGEYTKMTIRLPLKRETEGKDDSTADRR